MSEYTLVGRSTKRNNLKETKTSVKFIYKGKQYNHILPESMTVNGETIHLDGTKFEKYAKTFIENYALKRVINNLEKIEKETPEQRLARLSQNDLNRQRDKKKFAELPSDVRESMKLGSLKGLVNSLIKHKVIKKEGVDFSALKNYF